MWGMRAGTNSQIMQRASVLVGKVGWKIGGISVTVVVFTRPPACSDMQRYEPRMEPVKGTSAALL